MKRILATLAVAMALTTSGPLSHADTPRKQVRVGVVYPESPSTTLPGVSVFWQRIHELGWVEGQNLEIEPRWAQSDLQRLPGLMSELVERHVDVIVTWTTPAALAAKAATIKSATPVVVAAMGDPLATGIVTSLSHPGANITGLSLGHDAQFSAKWLQILQEERLEHWA